MDRELTAVIVMPWRRLSSHAVTIVTVDAKRRMAVRNEVPTSGWGMERASMMSPFEPGSQHRVENTIVANANVGNENNADGKVVLIEFFHYMMGWPAVYKLTESVPYLLNRVGVRMGELFSRRIASHGVSLPMYRVMAAL